jgi:hypothetical protein
MTGDAPALAYFCSTQLTLPNISLDNLRVDFEQACDLICGKIIFTHINCSS